MTGGQVAIRCWRGVDGRGTCRNSKRIATLHSHIVHLSCHTTSLKHVEACRPDPSVKFCALVAPQLPCLVCLCQMPSEWLQLKLKHVGCEMIKSHPMTWMFEKYSTKKIKNICKHVKLDFVIDLSQEVWIWILVRALESSTSVTGSCAGSLKPRWRHIRQSMCVWFSAFSVHSTNPQCAYRTNV